ncbi:F0F1 ATP synthase subunit delta [Collinsella tanakaei]|uniref:F0F1 ATP synthase subunit delta n=1 Tax=Collinsella tanakaei TaxID=626935 RepID=UPI0025A41A04|nr:F0F1 ATP synthase subunit delta [Collinsella tanakaei]MDM8300967.1 F0F1 ATP synthase subunit delta [Collinsella tanakaei]
MPTSRRENRVLETYARALLEAAKAEGRVFTDLDALGALSQASPEILAVVKTMVERDQLDLLPQVAEAYRAMTEDDEDVVGVTVTTAVELDDELRAQIVAMCEEQLGSRVSLIERVDPSIIGGIVLEARGQRRDISVKTQLRAARKTLGEAQLTLGGEASNG